MPKVLQLYMLLSTPIFPILVIYNSAEFNKMNVYIQYVSLCLALRTLVVSQIRSDLYNL